MKVCNRLFIYLLLYFVVPQLFAQYPFYKNYNINDGLVSNKIYNIIEDKHGFIWICTDRGVSRYDGVDFVNFTTKDGLPDNEVLSLFEDKTGRIWFNSFSTEPGYYYQGKIYNAGNDTFLSRIKQNKPEGTCLSMIVQKNNSLAFLIHGDNRKLIIGKDIQDIEVFDEYVLRGFLFQNILIQHQSTYYVISPLEIISWKKGDSVRLLDKSIWDLKFNYSKAPGTSLIGLHYYKKPTRVLQIDLNTFKKREIPVASKYKSLFVFNQWNVLTGDSFYTVFNDSFTRLIESVKLPFLFERVYLDRKGNKWFGSADHGIYFMRKNAPTLFDLSEGRKKGILAIEQFGQNLFLRTETNGLISIQTTEKSKILFNHPVYKRIRGFAPAGNYYLVGTDGGLFRLNKSFSNPKKLNNVGIKDIETGLDDEVLIGAASFSAIYKGDSFHIIDYNRRTMAICRVSKNKIWFGGLKGLAENLQNGNSFVTRKLKLNAEIDNSRIVDIKKDKSGNVWIATDQKGIFFYSNQGEIISFRESSGKQLRVISDICQQIVIAKDSSIWLATVGGISVISYQLRYSKPVFMVRNYSISEGMPGKTINSIAFWGKKIMVATPDGLYSFNGLDLPSLETSETVITRVEVNSRLFSQNKISLPYHQNNLIISYASSFINTGEAYLFKYRVKGLNKNWIETKTMQVPLLGLESGTYVFEIASVNSQGEVGPITTFSFRINRPWFQQWWFILLVLLGLLLSIGYYYKLIKDKITLSKKLTLLRLRILRAQMNPHFVFNALSNIQRLIHVKELKDANDYIGTLASIMRKSIDYSDKEFIQLDKEIEYTNSYLEIEKLRFNEKFNYSLVSTITENDMQGIFVPPLLLQPLVENTIKHAFKGVDYKGQLNVTIEKLGDLMLRYTISDNGCGFDATKISTSEYGLGIAKERIELLYKNMHKKGSFLIESKTENPENGTTITIDLPILKD